MLQAMNTGHDGSLSTIHANTPRDALARVETMVLMAGYDLPVRAIREQVSSALECIIHLERLEDGSRRVTSITEVQGMESDVITMQELFKFQIDEVTRDGTIVGGLRPTGLRPTFLQKFEKRGIAFPLGLFREGAEIRSSIQARSGSRPAVKRTRSSSLFCGYPRGRVVAGRRVASAPSRSPRPMAGFPDAPTSVLSPKRQAAHRRGDVTTRTESGRRLARPAAVRGRRARTIVS